MEDFTYKYLLEIIVTAAKAGGWEIAFPGSAEDNDEERANWIMVGEELGEVVETIIEGGLHDEIQHYDTAETEEDEEEEEEEVLSFDDK